MNDWRTTLTALVTGIALLLAHFNIILTPEMQSLIVGLAVVVIGLLARDAKNTTPIR